MGKGIPNGQNGPKRFVFMQPGDAVHTTLPANNTCCLTAYHTVPEEPLFELCATCAQRGNI